MPGDGAPGASEIFVIHCYFFLSLLMLFVLYFFIIKITFIYYIRLLINELSQAIMDGTTLVPDSAASVL